MPLQPKKTDEQRHWYALYTKGRHEKFIETHLRKMLIESFLPLRAVKRRWSDRTVSIEEPLFKSYLFVKSDTLQSQIVLRTKGAVKFVASQGRPIAVEETVIESLKKLISGEISVDPFPYLATGDKVYVKSGAFKGVEGIIVRKNEKKCRLVVSLVAIQASVSVEIDACLVERI